MKSQAVQTLRTALFFDAETLNAYVKLDTLQKRLMTTFIGKMGKKYSKLGAWLQ